MDFFMQELGVPGSQLVLAAEQTLYMVFLSLFIGTVLGLIIAVTLVVTNPNGIIKNSVVYTITNTIVNIVRSVPFIILIQERPKHQGRVRAEPSGVLPSQGCHQLQSLLHDGS